MRKQFSHDFSPQALAKQEDIIQYYIDMMITQLDKNCTEQPGDVRDWYNFCTFDIIGELAFGEPFGSTASGTFIRSFLFSWTGKADVPPRRASFLGNGTVRKPNHAIVPPSTAILQSIRKFVRYFVRVWAIAEEIQAAKGSADAVL